MTATARLLRPRRALVIAAVVSVALAGCSSTAPSPPEPAGVAGSRTVLVHKIADTNLEPDMTTDVGDVNTGDPEVLACFVTQGITDYPADHYSLIISDHGASWPGVAGDVSTDYDSLSMTDFGGNSDAVNAIFEVPQAPNAGGWRPRSTTAASQTRRTRR